LTRREAGSLLAQPSLYLVTAFFVLIGSLNFFEVVYNIKVATFEPMAACACFLSLLLAPLITMKMFAEETASGTIELLLTAPVRPVEIVLSKFFGAYFYYCLTLLPYAAFAILLSVYGDVDRGAVITGVLSLLLTGALFVAAGLFVSSLTSSQIVAAAASCAILIILLALSYFHDYGGVLGMLGYASFHPHFERFLPGVIDTRDLFYFASATCGVLFLAWLVVNSRGALLRGGGSPRRGWMIAAGLLLVLSIEFLLYGIARLHIAGTDPERIVALLGDKGIFAVAGETWALLLALLFLAGALASHWFSRQGTAVERISGLLRTDLVPTLLAAGSVALIIVNLNYYSSLLHCDWDLSEGAENTLALDTRMTLDELRDRADIQVFFSREVDYKKVDLAQETRRLLKRYASYSPRIRLSFVDSLLESEKALELARKLDFDPAHMPYLAVASYQGRRVPVPAQALLKQPTAQQQMSGDKQFSYNGEMAFTIALKRLLDPRTTRVVFSTGHGEMNVEEKDKRPGLAGEFSATLRREAFDVNLLALKGDPIPPDCDVLVLAGPRVPIGKDVAASLEEFVLRGGRLLLLLPETNLNRDGSEDDRDEDLMALVKSWGGSPRGDTVFDARNNENGQTSIIYVTASEAHSIAKGGRAVVCLLPRARSIRELPSVSDHGWQMDRLLLSTEYSVANQTVDGKMKPRHGPLTLGFTAAKNTVPEPRVVVIGNSEFVGNQFIDKAHNRSFAVSCIYWLAGRDYKIRISPKDHVDRNLDLTGSDKKTVSWVALVALPQIWLLLGALVWWVRKQ
jgi:ABC-2 type transport system permease protein